MPRRPKDMPEHLNYKGEERVRKKYASIDVSELERLARLHVTNIEMSKWFDCDIHTLSLEPYRSIIEKAKSETKQRLKQKAIQRAMIDNSDTMLIFCLKNYCGWGDRGILEVVNETSEQYKNAKEILEEVIGGDKQGDVVH